MRRTGAKGYVGWIIWFLVCHAVAGEANIQFSAQAIQRAPDKQEQRALIYVGDAKVRIERLKEDRVFVEIYDMQNQRAMLLVPELKTYIENRMPEGGITNPMLPPESSDPCAGVAGASCTLLGNEPVYGIDASKWEMIVDSGDRPNRSLHWVDRKRYLPLRDIWADGSVTEMKFAGPEILEDRTTERWEVTHSEPGGATSTSVQWYDPQLGISIGERLSDGRFRGLVNIQVQPQPDELFVVPEDYREIHVGSPQDDAAAGVE